MYKIRCLTQSVLEKEVYGVFLELENDKSDIYRQYCIQGTFEECENWILLHSVGKEGR